LIGDPVARECVVVDPAWEIDTIVETVAADGMTLKGALVTHTHQDHVGGSLAEWGMPGRIPGVEELLGKVATKVYVHKAEREFLRGFGSDLVQVDNHDTLDIGQLTLTFMHTPGHTPGSQCFLVGDRLVSGDTLFIGSCGRTDLPGSDPSDMYYSLTQLLADIVRSGRGEGAIPTTCPTCRRDLVRNPLPGVGLHVSACPDRHGAWMTSDVMETLHRFVAEHATLAARKRHQLRVLNRLLA